MKIRFGLIIGIPIALIAIWLWFRTSTHVDSSTANTASEHLPSAKIFAAVTTPSASSAASTTTEHPPRMKKHVMHGGQWTPEEQAMMQEWMNRGRKDSFAEWKSSIEFYGLVLDDVSNQPIDGANVKWITTITTGNGYGDTKSGTDGRFTINTTGNGINIDVKKDGYRTVNPNQSFNFSEFFREDYYDGDKDHPTVFRLHKIPPYEPLYMRGKQINPANNLVGTQWTINPVNGQWEQGIGSQGISIQMVLGPNNGAQREQYNIILRTSGEGVLVTTDANADEAPVSGYKNPCEQSILIDWNDERIAKVSVFFKDSAGHYGKVYFDIKLLAHDLSFMYMLRYNPNGGTSLSAPQGSQYQINKR